MICLVSFWDDIHSLPDSVRMVVQIVSTLLMFWSVGLYTAFDTWVWMVVVAAVALFFCVGATNIINFMDGINGITAGYALAMLVPLALVQEFKGSSVQEFIEPSYLVVAIIGVLVFSIFNLTIVFLLRTSAMLKRVWHCTRFGVGSGPKARRSALPGMWGASALRSSSCLRWGG